MADGNVDVRARIHAELTGEEEVRRKAEKLKESVERPFEININRSNEPTEEQMYDARMGRWTQEHYTGRQSVAEQRRTDTPHGLGGLSTEELLARREYQEEMLARTRTRHDEYAGRHAYTIEKQIARYDEELSGRNKERAGEKEAEAIRRHKESGEFDLDMGRRIERDPEGFGENVARGILKGFSRGGVSGGAQGAFGALSGFLGEASLGTLAAGGAGLFAAYQAFEWLRGGYKGVEGDTNAAMQLGFWNPHARILGNGGYLSDVYGRSGSQLLMTPEEMMQGEQAWEKYTGLSMPVRRYGTRTVRDFTNNPNMYGTVGWGKTAERYELPWSEDEQRIVDAGKRWQNIQNYTRVAGGVSPDQAQQFASEYAFLSTHGYSLSPDDQTKVLSVAGAIARATGNMKNEGFIMQGMTTARGFYSQMYGIPKSQEEVNDFYYSLNRAGFKGQEGMQIAFQGMGTLSQGYNNPLMSLAALDVLGDGASMTDIVKFMQNPYSSPKMLSRLRSYYANLYGSKDAEGMMYLQNFSGSMTFQKFQQMESGLGNFKHLTAPQLTGEDIGNANRTAAGSDTGKYLANKLILSADAKEAMIGLFTTMNDATSKILGLLRQD